MLDEKTRIIQAKMKESKISELGQHAKSRGLSRSSFVSMLIHDYIKVNS